jgi:predicted ATPase
MRITQFSAFNYKSLRDATIEPDVFNVLVGVNDAGKSNLADCIDLVSDAYRNGLRAAVLNKGGFENIVHRGPSKRENTVGIRIRVETGPPQAAIDSGLNKTSRVRIEHEFHFRKRESGAREDYVIEREGFTGVVASSSGHRQLFNVSRSSAGVTVAIPPEHKRPSGFEETFHWVDLISEFVGIIEPSELVPTLFARFEWPWKSMTTYVERIRVFQFSPWLARQPGPSSPNPGLERYGANLPAVIEALKRDHPVAWERILGSMRMINPRLDTIGVEATPSGLLGLYFFETGADRPWRGSEVSDGTIHFLALMTAIFDPESSCLVLEEPENSVHPWVVRIIVEACQEASREKQVLLTTHSPILVDMVRPRDVWLVSRDARGSHLGRLVDAEPRAEQFWNSGDLAISELLDGGSVDAYVPAGIRPSSAAADPVFDPDPEGD